MTTLSEEVEMLRSLPLFSGVDPARLKLLAFASRRLVFKNGQVLFRQGDRGDTAFLVISGIAEILVEDDKGEELIAEAGPNSFIGEIAIITELERTATVRARGELTVLAITKQHFLALLNDFPAIAIEVMGELGRRLAHLNEELLNTRRELEAISH